MHATDPEVPSKFSIYATLSLGETSPQPQLFHLCSVFHVPGISWREWLFNALFLLGGGEKKIRLDLEAGSQS